ncbi:MAG: Hsp20 family protein [Nanoarchaeota archaeon]|nr:Hsp20 family protein [Nanoarchaeota archaeon]MBU1322064.1 Hsp20 family protein [Nanoarchaeota archaeon]MBU1598385.1 Hsp20 family protein [Nanoarchaeota archaeon]MBU2441593.1 Hsp20 family protein [Nanoarchaeota archaeon]
MTKDLEKRKEHTPTRYDPFRTLWRNTWDDIGKRFDEMRREMDDAMGELEVEIEKSKVPMTTEQKDGLYIMNFNLGAQGFTEKDVTVEYKGDTLNIQGKRENTTDTLHESSMFQRQIYIPGLKDKEVVQSFENGMLTITLPDKVLPYVETKQLEE